MRTGTGTRIKGNNMCTCTCILVVYVGLSSSMHEFATMGDAGSTFAGSRTIEADAARSIVRPREPRTICAKWALCLRPGALELELVIRHKRSDAKRRYRYYKHASS